MKEMGGIRFEPNGDVTIITGTLDYGQGHWSAFAQVLDGEARHPVRAHKTDPGRQRPLIAGGGTGGSKSIMASGAAIVEASDKVIDKGKQIAAWRSKPRRPTSSSRPAASPSSAPTAASASWSWPSGCAAA
jgi:Aerobic-type carbon monoxide dehydrogenase, large subunit CoxL/CutL homologs